MWSALARPYLYPWPQRPAGLIDDAFAKLGRRWRPVLDAFDVAGVDVAYELPGRGGLRRRDLERCLDGVGNHPRCPINYDASHFGYAGSIPGALILTVLNGLLALFARANQADIVRRDHLLACRGIYALDRLTPRGS
ncbi:MAG TPA: hypothetical protein VGY52_16885 [Roseiarcus sp.]|nr:hypothetical protein [Roseiarcus sp.]